MAAVQTYNDASEKVKNADEVNDGRGGFAKTFTETASLFSDKTALRALNQGEEHGVNEYNEQEVRMNLLPRQEAHVKTFKKYL